MLQKSRLLLLVLLPIVGLIASPTGFAKTADLTISLIDASLATLRERSVTGMNETIEAYQVARTRLNSAESFDRDTARYVEALTSAPRLEAEILARIDKFDRNGSTSVELLDLSRDEWS